VAETIDRVPTAREDADHVELAIARAVDDVGPEASIARHRLIE
jgi:hypothetical protein